MFANLGRRKRRRDGLQGGAALAGLAAGVAVALLGGGRASRRRGRLSQQAIHSGKALEDFGGKASRDLAHRARGLFASTAARLRRDEPSAEVLAERVRARLGRLTSHPGAVEVLARDGVVELRGPILEAEVKQVLSGVARVRGVHEVVDRLERHGEAGSTPGLQGGAGVSRPVPDALQRVWMPGTRAIAFAAGSALAAWAIRRRGGVAVVAGTLGAWLIARAVTNLETKRLLGIGARRRAVDLHKTIRVGAPRREVFAFFSAFENFPRFMSHVREVRRSGDGRWHWRVEGPAGIPVEWDAELSAWSQDEVIAWKTVPGMAVESSGIVRFEEDGDATRLDIRLSYNPPAGALGHALATLLGADPKRQLDDDLMRLKSLLERGKAEGVTREEVGPRPPRP
jgi:uncharacterized membrane protein